MMIIRIIHAGKILLFWNRFAGYKSSIFVSLLFVSLELLFKHVLLYKHNWRIFSKFNRYVPLLFSLQMLN